MSMVKQISNPRFQVNTTGENGGFDHPNMRSPLRDMFLKWIVLGGTTDFETYPDILRTSMPF